jgi:hypothetical protein
VQGYTRFCRRALKYIVAKGCKYTVVQGYKRCGAGPQNILWRRDAEYTVAQGCKIYSVCLESEALAVIEFPLSEAHSCLDVTEEKNNINKTIHSG